jgi:hypothetical protein
MPTIDETYGPGMTIMDQDEADAYLAGLVLASARDGLTEPEATALHRENLGYYAGYYGRETRERVLRLFNAIHPVFGLVMNPTPQQAYDAGILRGSMSKQ